MVSQDLVLKTKIEIFRAVLALDPRALVFAELADALIAAGQPEEAVRVCRRGLGFNPADIAGRASLVEALLALNQPEAAARALAEAQRQVAQASQGQRRLAELEARLKLSPPDRVEEAAAAQPEPAEASGEQAPSLELATPTLADLYLRQGHAGEAIQVYRRMLARDPTNRAIRAKLKALGAPPANRAKAKLLEILLKWREAVRTRALASQG